MMDAELKAIGYDYNATNYTSELQRVLCGIYACYTMMLKDAVVLLNDENMIRNILLFDYLNNDIIKNNLELLDYVFNGEVLEPTGSKIDIKVQTTKQFIKSDEYFIVECKRLDNKNLTGTSGLNAKYIKNGICRFVSKYYSTYNRINAMIGFVVEAMDIHSNTINNINLLLSRISMCRTTQCFQKESFIPNFEYHYSSKHNDINNINFTLYHLMFDFSNNICKTKVL